MKQRSIESISMNADDYDEQSALASYISVHRGIFMTDEEQERLLAVRRQLVGTRTTASNRGRASKKLKKLEIEQVAKLRQVQHDIRSRIQQDIWAGRIEINRCPACSRIVRTHLAKQCLWCGHDWH